MKVSKNFDLREIIPKEIHQTYGDNGLWFTDPQSILMLQFIRDFFGRQIVVNNWHRQGPYNQRGYRVPESQVGGSRSQHKLARAYDISVEGLLPEEVHHEILTNEKQFLEVGLSTLESLEYTPTWTHIDSRTTRLNKILIVKPITRAEAANSEPSNQEDCSDADDYYFWNNGELIKADFRLF